MLEYLNCKEVLYITFQMDDDARSDLTANQRQANGNLDMQAKCEVTRATIGLRLSALE